MARSASVFLTLKGLDERVESRRQNNEITRIDRLIGVRHAGGHEHRPARSDINGAIVETKLERALENMPRFVVSVVHVHDRGPAAPPLVNAERVARRRKARGTGAIARASGHRWLRHHYVGR